MGMWVLFETGKKVPAVEHEKIQQQVQVFAKERPWSNSFELSLRFRGKFCYVDSVEKKNQRISPLCRLEYYGENKWSLGFYTYSNERYTPCYFSGGHDKGTLEEAISICEGYLIV